jgi:hypothetical protein
MRDVHGMYRGFGTQLAEEISPNCLLDQASPKLIVTDPASETPSKFLAIRQPNFVKQTLFSGGTALRIVWSIAV